MKKRNILLTPGPTPVPPETLQLMAEPIFHHRTPQYQAIFSRVSNDLKRIFETKNDVYTLTSSGTGAMEASMVNLLSPGDKIITAHAGKFGERWLELGKAYGMNVIDIDSPYGSAIDPEKIEKALKENPDAKALFLTHCETSTGVCHDIKSIAAMVQKTDAILVVDAISGLAADPLPQDAWRVDVVVGGSQKALMLPPGLAFLSLSQKAWKVAGRAKCQRYYYDLRYYKKSLETSDTPFTPALTLVLALEATLKRILNKGLERHLQETACLAYATRAGIAALNLRLFAKSRPSFGLTSVEVPEKIDGVKLVKVMRDEKGVTMAGGQGSMEGKIFRIAHMGFISKNDLVIGLKTLAETLSQCGHACNEKDAVEEFNKTLDRGATQKIVL